MNKILGPILLSALASIALAGTNDYSGKLSDIEITSTVTFPEPEDGTVSGSFFRNDDPNHLFSFAGTNEVEGVMEIRITNGDSLFGTGKLKKTLTESKIIWSGTFRFTDGTVAPFKFQRERESR